MADQDDNDEREAISCVFQHPVRDQRSHRLPWIGSRRFGTDYTQNSDVAEFDLITDFGAGFRESACGKLERALCAKRNFGESVRS